MTNSVIFQSIGLHLGGLLFLAFVSFMYFRNKKDRTKNYSSNYFIYLVITTYLMNLTQIGAFIARHLYEVKGMPGGEFWSLFLGRGFILSSLLFGAGLACYFVNKMLNKDENPKINKIVFYISHIIALIFFILTFFYEVKFHTTDPNRYVLNGPFSIWTYATFGISVLVLAVTMIMNRKNLVFNQWLVLIYVFVSFIILSVVEKLTNYDISEVPYIISLTITTLFFTHENTNYTKLQKLHKEELNNKEESSKISEKVNRKSQNIIESLNNSYVLINLTLNTNMTDVEVDNSIDNLIENNQKIISTLSSEEGDK